MFLNVYFTVLLFWSAKSKAKGKEGEYKHTHPF